MEREDGLAPTGAERDWAVAPAIVFAGPMALERLGSLGAGLGKRALVIAGRTSYPSARERLEASLLAAGVSWSLTYYGQDCCENELERLAGEVAGHDLVIGVGGGKALDTAKLVAHRAKLPVVTVPTSAATCAAWSALSNVYTPAGAWRYGVALDRCPDAMVLDAELVATAPVRLLAAGIADAMAKWVESSASVDLERADAMTYGAVEMARALYEKLRGVGEAACDEALAGRPGAAFAQAIEASLQLAGLVGGLGGARCRSVAAHAVANALSDRPGSRASLHGEKVAFGLVVQRVLQDFSEATLMELVRFLRALQLPLSLRGLGVGDDAAEIAEIARLIALPTSSAQLLPGGVTRERLEAALRRADALGRTAVIV